MPTQLSMHTFPWAPPDGGWELTLYATNIGDEQIITNSGNRPFLPPDGDDNVVTFNRGRQVALQLGIDF